MLQFNPPPPFSENNRPSESEREDADLWYSLRLLNGALNWRMALWCSCFVTREIRSRIRGCRQHRRNDSTVFILIDRDISTARSAARL